MSDVDLVQYRGLRWEVPAGVFVPRPDFGGAPVTARSQEMFAERSVLDVGCGCGVRAVLAMLSGARSAHAVDVDPAAVAATAANAARHGVTVRTWTSDLLDAVSGRYDTIVAYLPSEDRPVRSAADVSVHDPGLQLHERLIAGARAHLSAGGLVHLSVLDRDDARARVAAMAAAAQLTVVIDRQLADRDDRWHLLTLAPDPVTGAGPAGQRP